MGVSIVGTFDEACYLGTLHRLLGETFPSCYSDFHLGGVAILWIPTGIVAKLLSWATGISFTDWVIPLIGISGFIHWVLSLLLIDRILQIHDSRSKSEHFKNPIWAVIFTLAIPVLEYAFRNNFMTHTAELFILTCTYYFLLHKRFIWAFLFGLWLLFTRLNGIFIFLVLFGYLWDARQTQSSHRKIHWYQLLILTLLASPGLVYFYRVCFVTGYDGRLLSDVLGSVEIQGIYSAFTQWQYGILYHHFWWLLMLCYLSISWFKLNWSERAVCVWMCGIISLMIAQSSWGSIQSRQFVGSYLAAMVVFSSHLHKMPIHWARILKGSLVAAAIWNVYCYITMVPTVLKYLYTQIVPEGTFELYAVAKMLLHPALLIKTVLGLSPIGFTFFSWFKDEPMFGSYKSITEHALEGPPLWTMTAFTSFVLIAVVYICYQKKAKI